MGNTIDVMNLYVNRTAGASKASAKDSLSGGEDSSFRKVMDEASGQKDNRKPALDGSEDTSAKPTQEPVGDEKPQRQETKEEEIQASGQAAVLLAAMSQNSMVMQPETPETAGQTVSILTIGEELAVENAATMTLERLPAQSGEKAGVEWITEQGQQQPAVEALFGDEAKTTQGQAADAGAAVRELEQAALQDSSALMSSQAQEAVPAGDEGENASQAVRAFSSEAAAKPQDLRKADENQSKPMREQQPEAPVDTISQRMASQRLQEAAPVQPAVRMEVQEAKDLTEQLMAQIERMAAGQQKKLEIVLEPEHLGRIVIQIASSKEGTNVSMLCSEARTLNMLSARAADMGAILENRLGDHTVVYVDQQETNYLNQGRDESGAGGRRDQEQQESSKKKQKDESVDFVSRLRLQMMQGLEQNYQIG